MEFLRMFVGGVLGCILGAVLGIALTIGFVTWNVRHPNPRDESKGWSSPLAAFVLVPGCAVGGAILGIQKAIKKVLVM